MPVKHHIEVNRDYVKVCFPESEAWACDGVIMSRPQLAALIADMATVLASRSWGRDATDAG